MCPEDDGPAGTSKSQATMISSGTLAGLPFTNTSRHTHPQLAATGDRVLRRNPRFLANVGQNDTSYQARRRGREETPQSNLMYIPSNEARS